MRKLSQRTVIQPVTEAWCSGPSCIARYATNISTRRMGSLWRTARRSLEQVYVSRLLRRDSLETRRITGRQLVLVVFIGPPPPRLQHTYSASLCVGVGC
ncbi:hypothetical protein E2C01_040982 [Portunus trituberculatus]|uniref:Uncharacterized protein n=1 Tax=Portunus trituberculatus TaxID=210409 RepID=A0A5B7FIU0_PORTR|nr:hypothetical protein [Portunus trituberculatus]